MPAQAPTTKPTSPDAPTVNYTASDPLGSPRVLTNKQGDVISRRDFMPFGEEIAPGAETHRTAANKYGVGDGVRQKFTGYERDEDTGLDFAEARYYYSNHGRFTAVDPLLASGKSANPQTFNRYAYTMNRPLVLTDPTGLQTGSPPARKNLEIEQVDDPQKQFVDAKLTRVFTDGNGFVRSSSAVLANAFPGDSHYKLEDGTLHTIHIYGRQDGNAVTGIFVPKEFDRIEYDGRSENSVNAINSETGEVLRVSHVDVQSQKELNANLSSGRENEAGSRYIANTGGKGGDAEGNIHSHVTYFKSTPAMRKAMDAKYAPKNMSGGQTAYDYTSKEKAYMGDFRRFSTFRVCKSTRTVP